MEVMGLYHGETKKTKYDNRSHRGCVSSILNTVEDLVLIHLTFSSTVSFRWASWTHWVALVTFIVLGMMRTTGYALTPGFGQKLELVGRIRHGQGRGLPNPLMNGLLGLLQGL